MPEEYSIERARAEDLPYLPEVEQAAAELFSGWPVASSVACDALSEAELAQALADDLLWVVRAPTGEPVAFAVVEMLGKKPHLAELDVHPSHGRQGLGASLVEEVCSWAENAGHDAITLTTFRDVPWNAPFYARNGFRAIGPAELTTELSRVLRDEAERGLDPHERVVMRRELNVL